jgi:hypothetical protein
LAKSHPVLVNKCRDGFQVETGHGFIQAFAKRCDHQEVLPDGARPVPYEFNQQRPHSQKMSWWLSMVSHVACEREDVVGPELT